MPINVTARRSGGPLRCEVTTGEHVLVTDEPEDKGGMDTAMTPHSLLPAALASCVSTTILMYAVRKGWDVGDAQVEVDYDPDVPRFVVSVHLPDGLHSEQRERIMRVAGKCPVSRTLARDVALEYSIPA
jgi:putative redox protein